MEQLTKKHSVSPSRFFDALVCVSTLLLIEDKFRIDISIENPLGKCEILKYEWYYTADFRSRFSKYHF